MEYPEIQMLFNMKPRMTNIITKISGGVQMVPPQPLEIDSSDIKVLIEEILKGNFPDLEPVREVQVQV